MPERWKPLLALLLATLTSVVGTVGLRIASEQNSLALAVAGSSMWALSASGFIFASSRGAELGVLGATMSAAGILLINLIGIYWWAESTEPRKLIALALIVVAITLLAWPSTKT